MIAATAHSGKWGRGAGTEPRPYGMVRDAWSAVGGLWRALRTMWSVVIRQSLLSGE